MKGLTRPLKFNGVDLTKYVAVESISRPLLAPLTNTWTQRPINRLPQQHKVQSADPYLVTVTYSVFGNTHEDMRVKASELAGLLFTSKPAPLITDNTGRYEMAILDGASEVNVVPNHALRGTLTFYVADGFSRSQNKVVGTGTAINNIGNMETPAVIKATITTATNSWVISNGSLAIKIKRELAVGNIVTIYLEQEKVTLRGSSTTPETLIMTGLTLDSDFFWLKTGVNNLTTTGATLAWEFEPRWR